MKSTLDFVEAGVQMQEVAVDEIVGEQKAKVTEDLDTLQLIPKEDLKQRFTAAGREFDTDVIDAIYKVDVDGSGELDIIEVYNLIEKKHKQNKALSRRNKFIFALSIFSAFLLAGNVALSFVAVEMGKQLNLNSNSGEATVAGGSKVITQGAALRHFKIADLPMLSFDYLEQVEKLTVLYDKRLHLFNVASFEWLSSTAMNVYFQTGQYVLTVDRSGDDAEVYITETLANGTKVQHFVWSTAYKVNIMGTFADYHADYWAHVKSLVPAECEPAIDGVGEFKEDGVFHETPNLKISRMCYECFALSDPTNRGGEVELRVGAQEHGLTDWEIANIATIWEADARKQGWGRWLDMMDDGTPVAVDPFKFNENDAKYFLDSFFEMNFLWPGAIARAPVAAV